MKRVWCPCCMAMTEPEIVGQMDTFSFERQSYRYHRKEAICKVCKCTLNIPDVVDDNVRARIDAIYEGRKIDR